MHMALIDNSLNDMLNVITRQQLICTRQKVVAVFVAKVTMRSYSIYHENTSVCAIFMFLHILTFNSHRPVPLAAGMLDHWFHPCCVGTLTCEIATKTRNPSLNKTHRQVYNSAAADVPYTPGTTFLPQGVCFHLRLCFGAAALSRQYFLPQRSFQVYIYVI